MRDSEQPSLRLGLRLLATLRMARTRCVVTDYYFSAAEVMTWRSIKKCASRERGSVESCSICRRSWTLASLALGTSGGGVPDLFGCKLRLRRDLKRSEGLGSFLKEFFLMAPQSRNLRSSLTSLARTDLTVTDRVVYKSAKHFCTRDI